MDHHGLTFDRSNIYFQQQPYFFSSSNTTLMYDIF